MGGYQIIKFIEENAVEVVPSIWLTQKGERNICFWPNTPSQSAVSMAIKSQQSPKDDWKKYTVEVLSKHAYESFATATTKATKATYDSCLESGNEGILPGMDGTEPTKRSRKRNKRIISSSEEDEVPMRRSPRIKMRDSRSPINCPTPPTLQRPNSQNISFQAIQNVKSNLEKKMTSENHSQKKCSSCIKHEELFAQIIRLLHIINGRVGQNSELITVLNSQQSGSTTNTAISENETPPDIDIPAKSREELMNLDEKLKDPKVKEFLVNKLVHVGGHNIKDLIKRIIPRLVSDEVLKEFSWIGGKGKKIFSNLKLSCLIKDVCKQNKETRGVTEKVVEETVAVFLTKATERCNRKMIKEGKNTEVNGEDLHKKFKNFDLFYYLFYTLSYTCIRDDMFWFCRMIKEGKNTQVNSGDQSI